MEVLQTRRRETVYISPSKTATVFNSSNILIGSSIPIISFFPTLPKLSSLSPFNLEYIPNKAIVLSPYGLKGGGLCVSKCFSSNSKAASSSEVRARVNNRMQMSNPNNMQVQQEISENLEQLKEACNSSILENIVLSVNFLYSIEPSDYSNPLSVSLALLEILTTENIWEQVTWADIRKKIAAISRKLIMYAYYKAEDRVQMFTTTKDKTIPFANSIIDRVLEEEENFPENGLLCEIKAILAIIKVMKDSERWFKSLFNSGKNIFDIVFNKDPSAIFQGLKDFIDFARTKIQHRMSIHLVCLDFIGIQEIKEKVELLSDFLQEFKGSKWQLLYPILDEIEKVLLESEASLSQKELLFIGNSKKVGVKSFANFNQYMLMNNWRIREKVAVILIKIVNKNEELKNEANDIVADRVIFETDLRVKDIFSNPSIMQSSHDLLQATWERRKNRFERLLEDEKNILLGLEKKLNECKSSEKNQILELIQSQRNNFEKQINEINTLVGRLGKTAEFLEKYESYTSQMKNDILSAIQEGNTRLERNFDRKFSDVMHKLALKSPRSDANDLYWMPTSSPHFVGRDKELDQINDYLQQFKRKVCLLAIVGMGGVGKTQLVLEFASSARDYFGALWFINAESKIKIESGLKDMAASLSIDLDLKQADIIRRVLVSLAKQRKPWLLVYDGVVNPKDLDPYIPLGKGMILVTSRNPCWDLSINLQGFDRESSLKLMKSITGIRTDDNASRIAEELGDLPLAICQAASFIKQTNSDYEEYIVLYKNRNSSMMDLSDYSEGLASSWNLNVKQISEASETCNLWLHCLAYLSPNQIPDPLSKSIFEQIEQKDNLLQYKKCIKLALGFSLIEVDDQKCINMHKLVQGFMRKLQHSDSTITEVLESVFLSMFTMQQEIELNKSLVPHLEFFLLNSNQNISESGELYSRLGIYYLEIMQNVEIASKFIHTALIKKVEKYGKTSLEAAQIYNNLGNVFFEQSDLKQAILYYRKALTIKKRHLDPNALEIAYSYNNLGICFFQQSNMPEAVNYILKAMELMKKHLGEDDISITTTYMNLGMAYDEMTQYVKAERYLELAKKVRSAHLPSKHPDIADCLLNLGILHSKINKNRQALAEIQQAYEILEESLGIENPSTINAKEHYARIAKQSKVNIS